MPIKKHVIVSSLISWALWEISESYQELCGMLPLDDHDRDHLSSVNHDKKRREYLAGRMAVKDLLIQRHLAFNGIYKDEWGKPHLLDSPFHISISNTYPYAVAMLNQKSPAGIDMEKTDPKFLKIRHKFLNPEELDRAGDNLVALNIHWCAKEALYKVFGKKSLSFQKHILIDPFKLGASGMLNGQIAVGGIAEKHRLEYLQWNGYIICYNVPSFYSKAGIG